LMQALNDREAASLAPANERKTQEIATRLFAKFEASV